MKYIVTFLFAFLLLNSAQALDSIPREAISSCLGKVLNDDCTMYIKGKDQKGLCKALVDKEYFVCTKIDKVNILNNKPSSDLLFTPISR